MLNNVEFHSFHWDNFSPEILTAHRKVMQHFGLDVTYTQENIPHGEWLTRIMQHATKDIIAIIEPDLLPLNRHIIDTAIQYVTTHDSFIGCAQVSNHKHPASHVFASPAFFFITKSCYQKLGSPSFMPNYRSDVAEELCYTAEDKGIRYRTLYPTYYEKSPPDGVWRLGSYGVYGIGTVFADSVYHLFQSRHAENIALFVKRAEQVLDGTFTTQGFISSTTFNDVGRLIGLPKKRAWHKNLISQLKG